VFNSFIILFIKFLVQINIMCNQNDQKFFLVPKCRGWRWGSTVCFLKNLSNLEHLESLTYVCTVPFCLTQSSQLYNCQ